MYRFRTLRIALQNALCNMDAATPGDAVARPSSANPEMSGNDPNRGEADLSSIESDRVDDPKGLLDQDDHMRDMERVEMDVVCVKKPMATIRRVTGRIAPANPVAWTSPNVAIRMELETGQLVFSAANPDLGEAREEVLCDFDGKGVSLGVNPDYMGQFLSACETEKVRLEVKDENSQCITYPVDGLEKRYVCVIMPIRL